VVYFGWLAGARPLSGDESRSSDGATAKERVAR